ncbi:C4-dicarboxylate ABC transporter permease [Thalassospira marina]|uniref:C4-dicarboxylate ABC transporter permease n=2 Tax=Thalassospira marina TaxID=2048283 RepID=A0A2N3KTF0_9PROT|nr:C4-dicarboxylate ABC transporter permease [Thalassospira marina]
MPSKPSLAKHLSAASRTLSRVASPRSSLPSTVGEGFCGVSVGSSVFLDILYVRPDSFLVRDKFAETFLLTQWEEKIMKRMSMRAAIAALAFSVMPAMSHAEEISVTTVAGHPPVFLWVKTLSETFIPSVNAALEGTDYKINWNEAYGGTLAKPGGALEAIEFGLAQVGIVSTLFEPSNLSLQNVTYVTPFGSEDVDLVLKTVDQMHDEIPGMRSLWQDHDLEYLGGAFGLEDYLLMTKFPVNSLKDLEGKKINAPGAAVNWLENTGAVGVAGDLTTYYNDIQTGVADGVVVFPTAAAAAKLYEVAPYVTRAHFGAQYAGGIAVGKTWFEDQPAEIQDAFRKGVKDFAVAYRSGLEERVKNAFSSMEKGGATITELPAAERTAWANALPPIALNWAKEQDDHGLPGTEVIDTYIRHLKDAGVNLPRDWSAK